MAKSALEASSASRGARLEAPVLAVGKNAKGKERSTHLSADFAEPWEKRKILVCRPIVPRPIALYFGLDEVTASH